MFTSILQPSSEGQLMPGSYSRRAGTDRTLGSSRGFDLALLGGGTQQELCVYVRLSMKQEKTSWPREEGHQAGGAGQLAC